jgi:hypothetical protein
MIPQTLTARFLRASSSRSPILTCSAVSTEAQQIHELVTDMVSHDETTARLAGLSESMNHLSMNVQQSTLRTVVERRLFQKPALPRSTESRFPVEHIQAVCLRSCCGVDCLNALKKVVCHGSWVELVSSCIDVEMILQSR